jgi:hypothetical protein
MGGFFSSHFSEGIAFNTHLQKLSEASVSKISLSPDFGKLTSGI